MAPHRVSAAAEGDKGGAEVGEAGEGGGLGGQLPVPVLAHCRLHCTPPCSFGDGRGGESRKRVGEGVLEGDLSDLGEPGDWKWFPFMQRLKNCNCLINYVEWRILLQAPCSSGWVALCGLGR